MWRHAYFRWSFFFALAFNVLFCLLIFAAVGPRFSVVIGIVYFVFYHWIPLWTAGAVILYLRKKGFESLVWELIIAVASGLMGMALTYFVLTATHGNRLPYLQGEQLLWNFFGSMWWSCLVYFLVAYWQTRNRAKEERRLREQAQLRALRYQINPHFLFNSLNTISAYLRGEPDRADQVLHDLAGLLRYSLDTAERETVALADELANIRKYMSIEQARHGENLVFHLNEPGQAESFQIPPLLIQPLVENAVKHGMDEGALTVTLNVEKTEKGLKVVVRDNGPGFPKRVMSQQAGTGIGLENVSRRIKGMHGARFALSNHKGAVAEIELEARS